MVIRADCLTTLIQIKKLARGKLFYLAGFIYFNNSALTVSSILNDSAESGASQ